MQSASMGHKRQLILPLLLPGRDLVESVEETKTTKKTTPLTESIWKPSRKQKKPKKPKIPPEIRDPWEVALSSFSLISREVCDFRFFVVFFFVFAMVSIMFFFVSVRGFVFLFPRHFPLDPSMVRGVGE